MVSSSTAELVGNLLIASNPSYAYDLISESSVNPFEEDAIGKLSRLVGAADELKVLAGLVAPVQEQEEQTTEVPENDDQG
jgi:hypothetical protein